MRRGIVSLEVPISREIVFRIVVVPRVFSFKELGGQPKGISPTFSIRETDPGLSIDALFSFEILGR
jgi:hypothetical protein